MELHEMHPDLSIEHPFLQKMEVRRQFYMSSHF